jgi:hypothetical protein
MKKVFVIVIEEFESEVQILSVCSDLRKCKEEILKYLYSIHFDSGFTNDSEETFVGKYIDNFEENYSDITFPDYFNIYHVERNLI